MEQRFSSHLIIQLISLLILVCSISMQFAYADSPPKLPLPPCEVVDGEEVGACLNESFWVQGSAASDFAPGSSVQITTTPDPAVCVSMNGGTGVWTPSPCYAGVSRAVVLNCGVIDLTDEGKFKEMSCTRALYKDSSILEGPLFTVNGVDGNACGGSGNFVTYIYGGPANVPGGKWMEFGPPRRFCEISFNGPRPDGLFGPTWVKVAVGTSIAQTGDGRTPDTFASTEFFVPIDGDVRPFVDANFEADVFGLIATFENTTLSAETDEESLSYTWDFGDGNTSNEFAPEHLYSEPGVYEVTLTAEDLSGNMDDETKSIETEDGLIIEITGPQSIENGDEENYEVKVGNFEDSAISDFTIEVSDTGMLLEQQGIPQPAVLSRIEQNAVFTSGILVEALQSGETILQVTGGGRLASGEDTATTATLDVAVQPSLNLDLSAPFVEVSGEEVTITLTISNSEDVEVTNIRVESLLTLPNELVEYISGPLDANGSDPRVNPISLDAGESITVTWVYLTEGAGIVDMQASIAFDSITDMGRAIKTVDGKFAIEVAALELTNLRLQPGKPIPGEFAFIRGTINNIGEIDISEIDFELMDEEENEPVPEFTHIEKLVEELDEEISPRIELLEGGQSQDFIIPVGMILDVGSANRYTLPVRFKGTAVIEEVDEGEEVEVTVEEILRDDIDRTKYWEDLLDEYFALLVNGAISVIDEIDAFGDSSLIGGISVGSAEGVIAAFESMGSGGLSFVDFLGETSGDGGEKLTKQAQQIVNVITEYNNTTTTTEKLIDLAELEESIAIDGVDIFASWMFDVEIAAREGRSRDVAKLLAEPTTNVATGLGVEQAGAQIFAKLLNTGLGRKVLFKLTKKFDVPNESSGAAIVGKYIDDLDASFDDLPAGVPLTGQHALMAGVEGDDLAFMLDTAKLTNATFFVRPRPASAAKWAKAGYNAKPLPVKMKSVSPIDSEWLGYNSADSGLVVIREPNDPTDKLRDAIANGDLDIDEDRAEIQAILNRYSAKKAEFENIEATLAKLNTVKKHKIVKDPDPANPEFDVVEEVEQAGIVVKRYGRDVITTVSVDPGTGRLIFDYNGKPVYSDIDLLSVANRSGKNISPTLHEKILKESSYGFDGQHHATAQTSDFPKAEFAQKTAEQYLGEHTIAGEGLLIISPEGITKGFVDSFDTISLAEAKALDAGKIKLSNYDLYGLVVKDVTYIGVQTK